MKTYQVTFLEPMPPLHLLDLDCGGLPFDAQKNEGKLIVKAEATPVVRGVEVSIEEI